MKQQVLIIHGGNAFERYGEYLQSLRSREITFEDLRVIGWKKSPSQDLGEKYEVYNPQMPNKDNTRYLEWKIRLEKIINLMDDGLFLIGRGREELGEL